MPKKKKSHKGFKLIHKLAIALLIVISVMIAAFYWMMLETGKRTYQVRSYQVNTMVENYPTFFTTVYEDIFSSALDCQLDVNDCTLINRQKFDALSDGVVEKPVAFEPDSCFLRNNSRFTPSNRQPIYFIQLLPDGKIAKLFFSGELVIEEVDTREEKMVVSLLKGERDTLYGPFFNNEIIDFNEDGTRAWYDFKPNYLKDFYSQMEVITPYKSESGEAMGIVYIHGE